MHQIVFAVMLNWERFQTVLQRKAVRAVVDRELGIRDVEAVVHAGLRGCRVCRVEVFFEVAEPDSFFPPFLSAKIFFFKRRSRVCTYPVPVATSATDKILS